MNLVASNINENQSYIETLPVKPSKEVSGVAEWADKGLNLFYGCENNCKYCYARSFIETRLKKVEKGCWNEPKLKEVILEKNYRKRKGTTMFPTTHDITESNVDQCIVLLKKYLNPGNNVLIVSKPRIEVVKKLCSELEEYKENILFRFTIGSSNDDVLKFWEPNAPCFNERLESLKYAYENGYKTSVSCEPMLEGMIEDVIEKVSKYVSDSIWLGVVRKLGRFLKLYKENSKENIERAKELERLYSIPRIMDLYETYKDNSMIKWKDSLKKIIGLDLAPKAGLDI
ncbi:MAG: hypothetical protein C0412_00010 [Flavobacterium sp.]|nr:hypothetical protein [Flavobacterium sp.]